MKKLSKEQLQGMNKKQLYDYCRSNRIKGYSNRNKAYIVNLILNFYKSGQFGMLKHPTKKTQSYFIFYSNRSDDIGKIKIEKYIYKPSKKEIYEKYGPLYSIDGPFKTKKDVIKALKNEGYKDKDIGKILKSPIKKPTLKEIKKIKDEMAKSRDSRYGDIRYKEYTISPDIKESGSISGWYLDRRPNIRFHPGTGLSGFTTGSTKIINYGKFKKIDDLVIKIIELEKV